ncbi:MULTISPECIES: myo-inosose-2 dehydratase [unclassified Methylobacterium]|jgi:myo-inosose-2 dehydratase|uniref:myo-inosose-2 dehydratase n=1 Tax=unclassified Methylobacterium TaxID=2615210 RepID=UPI001355EA66|nr:myo-inosose-2 dehydratase [Methylobacterium sp. 2A]MWV23471.1 myo-inosose-2 dehydratase [Methylobacterium sp. 2A]
MKVRIGANPIGWSNDDMRELGGETPLETCLAEAASIGLAGMELGHKFPREPDALRAALAPFGLACISGWYSAELLRRDAEAECAALRPHLDLLKAVGSRVLVFAETSNAIHCDRSKPLSQRPVLAEGAWAAFGRRLTAVAEATRREGVRLVYHHHMGTIVQSEADIHALMAATGDAVGLLLDTGHACWGGADPAALAARYRERIFHVHTKDVRPDVRALAEAEDWSFLDAVLAGIYTVPGDGCIDFEAVLRELPDYEGWLVIEAEQDPAKANPLLFHRLGHRHLTALLSGTGAIAA